MAIAVNHGFIANSAAVDVILGGSARTGRYRFAIAVEHGFVWNSAADSDYSVKSLKWIRSEISLTGGVTSTVYTRV